MHEIFLFTVVKICYYDSLILYFLTEPVIDVPTVPDHDRSEALKKKPKMSHLLNQVAVKASDKWEILGIHLGVSYDQLKIISNEKQDYVTCYAAVFEQWRKNGTLPYTWATIIDTLKEPSVDMVDLASELKLWVDMNT